MIFTLDDEVCETTMMTEPFSSKRKAHLENPSQELQTGENLCPITEQFSQRNKHRKFNMNAKASTERLTSQLSKDQTVDITRIYTR